MPDPGLLWLPAAALLCLTLAWALLCVAGRAGRRRRPRPAAVALLGVALYAGAGILWAGALARAAGSPMLGALAQLVWPPTGVWWLGLWPVWVADRLGLFGFRLS